MSNGIPSLCEFIKLCKCLTFPLLNISVSCESEMKRIDNGEQLEFLAIFVYIFFLHLCQNIYLYLFQHIYLDLSVSTSLSQAALPGQPPRPTSASSGVEQSGEAANARTQPRISGPVFFWFFILGPDFF